MSSEFWPCGYGLSGSTWPPHQGSCQVWNLSSSHWPATPQTLPSGEILAVGSLCPAPLLWVCFKSGPHFTVPCQDLLGLILWLRPAPRLLQQVPAAQAPGHTSLGYLSPPGVGWVQIGAGWGLRAQVPVLERATRDETTPPRPPSSGYQTHLHPGQGLRGQQAHRDGVHKAGGGGTSRGRLRASRARSPLPGSPRSLDCRPRSRDRRCDWRKVPGPLRLAARPARLLQLCRPARPSRPAARAARGRGRGAGGSGGSRRSVRRHAAPCAALRALRPRPPAPASRRTCRRRGRHCPRGQPWGCAGLWRGLRGGTARPVGLGGALLPRTESSGLSVLPARTQRCGSVPSGLTREPGARGSGPGRAEGGIGWLYPGGSDPARGPASPACSPGALRGPQVSAERAGGALELLRTEGPARSGAVRALGSSRARGPLPAGHPHRDISLRVASFRFELREDWRPELPPQPTLWARMASDGRGGSQ